MTYSVLKVPLNPNQPTNRAAVKQMESVSHHHVRTYCSANLKVNIRKQSQSVYKEIG